MSSAPSAFKNDSKKLLKKLKIICEGSAQDSLENFKLLISRKFNLGELDTEWCSLYSSEIYPNLVILMENLSANIPGNPYQISDLLVLIDFNDENELSQDFSSKELKDYFADLAVTTKKCLRPYANTKIVKHHFMFELHLHDKGIINFWIKFEEGRLRENLYNYFKRDLSGIDLTKYIIQMFDLTLCIDKELVIEASPDLSSFKLIYIDTIEIPITLEKENVIKIIPIDNVQLTVMQNKRLINMEERILFLVDYHHHKGHFLESEYVISTVDYFIRLQLTKKIEIVNFIADDDRKYNIQIVDGKLKHQNGSSEIEFYKFMKFSIKLLPEIGPLYDSLNVNLTQPGELQFEFLEKHLKNLHFIFKDSKNFYAPLSSFIQSSGFGKTKLSLDLLQKHPGIYCVFRKDEHSGIPRMSLWMKKFLYFVAESTNDSLPPTSHINKAFANECTPGRFLIGVSYILEEYHRILSAETNPTEQRIQYLIKKIGLSFAEEDDESTRFFSPSFKNNPMLKFEEVSDKIHEFLDKIFVLTKSPDYPFLIILDELDLFNFGKNPERSKGLNIVRRGLHYLGNSIDLFVLGVGTNSDALDFTPTIMDDSLRSSSRKNLLPPFILSGNFDIFSSVVNYNEIVLNQNSIRNTAMFSVLVSFGRALWSSCLLAEVMEIAEAKLRNGSTRFNGALLALLMVRANLSVNVNHFLARSLVKSYMAIVNYVSTNANDMKVGYSSEPVLAMAARSLLSDRSTRDQCFMALKEFLFQRAIDKGRIVEAIFEHLILFSIDDSRLTNEDLFDNPNAKEFPSTIRDKLLNCKTFLLSCQRNPETGPILSNGTSSLNALSNIDLVKNRESTYHILQLKTLLQNLLKNEFGIDLERLINPSTMNSLIGTSHFVQIGSVKDDYFKEIPNFKSGKAGIRNIIDKALLKVGILRQCGYTMPPNYPGIDFIIPILIPRPISNKSDGIFSFVAVQSKATKEDIVKCTFKMSGIFHLKRCPNQNHRTELDCKKHKCKAFMAFSDIEKILQNQVVILLAAKGAEKSSLKTTVCLKGLTCNAIQNIVKAFKSKAKNKPPAVTEFMDELNEFAPTDLEKENIEAVAYPSYFDAIKNEYCPDILLKKDLNELVTVMKMTWSYTRKDLEKIFLDEDEIPKAKRTKEEAVKKRSVTCIAVNDIKFFDHLVGENGITLIREIINFSDSSFQNIERIHKPIVQNSMLNGTFCPYFDINPMMQRMRGSCETFPLLNNPIETYKETFTKNELASTIADCAIGPVNKPVAGFPDSYSEKTEKELDSQDYEKEFEKLVEK